MTTTAQDTPDWTGTSQVSNVPGTVLATGDALTFLGTLAFATSTSKEWVIPATKIGRTLGALQVVSTSPNAACVVVRPEPTEVVYTASPTFVAPFGPIPTSSTYRQAIVPIANLATDRLYVTAYFTASSSGTLLAWGLTANPGVPMRADGRAYPMGSRIRWTAAGTATDTSPIIPAPTAPLRVLIQNANVTVVGWTGTAETALKVASITVTLGGDATTGIAIVGCANPDSNALTVAPPGGILCDPGTEVRLHARAVPHPYCYATVAYDLVV